MFRKSLAINEALGRKEGMATQYGNLSPPDDPIANEQATQRALALFESVAGPLFTSFVARAHEQGFRAKTECWTYGKDNLGVSVRFRPNANPESEKGDQWSGYSIWLLAEQQVVCHTHYFGQGEAGTGEDLTTCCRRGIESINEDTINQCLVELTHRALDLQEQLA